MVELIIGGARSGKSALAEARARDSRLEVLYIATAIAGDAEMADRIAHHRARRPPHWRTIETPASLAETLVAESSPGQCIIVDCLTLWLAGLIDDPVHRVADVDALVAVLPALSGRVLLVSNEVGSGIVPANALARHFADEQGRLNQRVAAACDRVTLVVAGLPLELKVAS